MPPLLALALAALPAQPAADAPGGELVEEVVAVIRNPAGAPPRPITLSRLTDEARVVLVSRGAVEAASRPIDRPALRAALGWVLDQVLVADEAARLRVAEVGREETLAELHRFRARFPDAQAYARFLARTELGEEELTAILARTLRVDRYLETRVGRGAAVADDELDAYARRRGLSAATPAARDAVRARLAQEELEGRVQALLRELQARADVRVLDPELAGPGGEERR